MARCDVVIITIREDENLAVLNRLPNPDFLPCQNRTYTVAKVKNRNGGEYSVAVIRIPEQGQNAAQDTARDAIEDLHPRWLMLVGIAGAMPDREFTLGDVIVGSRLHDFTVGAYIEGAMPEVANQGGPMTKEVQDLVALIPALGEKLSGWESAPALRVPRPSVTVSAANLYGNKSWKTKTKSALAFHFETTGHRSHPIATTRAIASSGYLIKDTQIASTWRTASRDVMAVEMELAGVYAAAQRRAKEYSIIAVRGISDVVGFKREPEWTAYACEAAASFCISLLQNVPGHFLGDVPQPSEGSPPSSSATHAPIVNVRSNVPAQPNIALVGRENDLTQMATLLGDPRTARVLVLHGHSGTGKSELAKEFARRHAGRYPGGMFVLDASSGALALEFARIGKTLLGMEFPADMSLPEQGDKVFFSLGVTPLLMIYDNVNSLESIVRWLPPAGRACHVLITTVQDRWDGWLSWKVDPLSRKDALKLIEQCGVHNLGARNALAGFAEGLPVQICSAALALARDERRGNPPSTKFLLASEADRSFRLVYDHLEQPVRLLLHSAAFLNPQRIGRVELLSHLQKALSWSEAQFQKALDSCFDLHLLEGTAELKMHQLFAGFLQTITLEQAQAELLKKIRVVQAERLKELGREVAKQPNRTDLASTLITFPLTPTAWVEYGSPIAFGEGETIGDALCEIGRFDEARPWFERAVATKEKGDTDGRIDHESLSASFHRVGFCLSETGNHAEALSWYKRAVAESEKGHVNGRVDHDGLGRSLHLVGVCLSRAGKYGEARAWFERAITEKKKGNQHNQVDHDSLSRSLHHIGACLLVMGKDSEAQLWYEHAVAEAEKGDVHGRVNHESLGRSLHSVGFRLSHTGKYAEPLSWYERAVAAKRKGDIFGRVDRKSLAGSLKAGAECLRELGKDTEAEAWAKEAADLESSVDS